MKRTIYETLAAFKANPIEAETTFNKNSKRWAYFDKHVFFMTAFDTYPDDELKATANRVIDYLHENDLIDYQSIAENFIYRCVGDNDTDVGMKTHTIRHIMDFYYEWLEDAVEDEDDGAEELLKAVEKAKEVWYWNELLENCLEWKNREYGLVRKVAHSF